MFIFTKNFSISTTSVRGLSKNQAHTSPIMPNHHAYQTAPQARASRLISQMLVAFFLPYTELLEK